MPEVTRLVGLGPPQSGNTTWLVKKANTAHRDGKKVTFFNRELRPSVLHDHYGLNPEIPIIRTDGREAIEIEDLYKEPKS